MYVVTNKAEVIAEMNVSDLVKATIICALIAYLVYSYPLVSQVLIIALLSLLWLSYLYRAVVKFHSR